MTEQGVSRAIRVFLILFVLIFGNEVLAGQVRWLEDSFEDFIDGTLDASGQDIYIRRDGKISTIHRYDINDDGYLDLFFGNTHDEQSVLPPVLCAVNADRKLFPQELPILGSDNVQVADLNHDGWADLIFSLKSNGLQTSRRFLTIAYGDKDGWSASRTGGFLTARNPLATAIVDINADGWLDIAVINADYKTSRYLPKKNIRVYLGSSSGFEIDKFEDFTAKGARWIVAEDFNCDGAADFAVLNRNGKLWVFLSSQSQKYAQPFEVALPKDGSLYISISAADCDLDGNIDLIVGTDRPHSYIVNGTANSQWHWSESFVSFPASNITAADLDGDLYPDLVLTYLAAGTASLASTSSAGEDSSKHLNILWGSPQGYSSLHHTPLAAKYAFATTAGDIDADGITDLAVAVYQTNKVYAAESLIYFGTSNRKFELAPKTVATQGATAVAIIPAKASTQGTVVFANSINGTLNERIPVYVYWGDGKDFSIDNRWEIPGQSGHKASATDLNADGYVDLLVTYTAHGGEYAAANPVCGTNIFWGAADGYDIDRRRTVIHKPWKNHCDIADLNRDGYLDIVLGGWDPWFGPQVGKSAEILIYYGSADGIDTQGGVSIESPGRSEGTVIADFNKDSWLDIAVTSATENTVRIFWGSKNGFDSVSQQNLYGAFPIAIEAADLNADGFLDLVVGNYQDRVNGFFDMGIIIFWGSTGGFRQWDSQWMPSHCVESPAIADFDQDGFLDLFLPNYHGQDRRDLIPSYIYWGGDKGFNPTVRTPLICNSASGAQVGDFNSDGLIDIAVSNHTDYGNHQTMSQVFYNDGNRFLAPKITLLPTLGSHYMFVQDMGHIYDRKYQQKYQSSLFKWESSLTSGNLTFKAKLPGKAQLIFSVRSARFARELKGRPWENVVANQFPIDPMHRCLQYRATFISDNGDRYPLLDSVTVTLTD